jgi:asparagine synthase (glutamine-hydrolysing)
MCGICGIIDHKKVLKASDRENLVTLMNKTQAHRGPDDNGIYSDGGVTLGHVRLSIIDLSSAGHQPMSYMDRYEIVFNGEIYNYIELRSELEAAGYTFKTHTDTEVIMASIDHFGKKECLSHFNGFWAFAVYDKADNSVFMSRDRYGVKPLYYTTQPGYLIFSSEIKSMLEDKNIKRVANDQAILDYLVNSFVDCEDYTFFNDIYRLPAGSFMHVDKDGNMSIDKFYTLEYKETVSGKTTPSMVKKFRHLFQDSIKLRMRADVPVGSCLSGGLDSSAIVCETARQIDILRNSKADPKSHTDNEYEISTTKSEIRSSENSNDGGKPSLEGTTTGKAIYTPSTYSSCYKNSPNDESKYIKMVIDKTGVNGYYTYPTGESLRDDLDNLIYTQDEPFLSTSMYASYSVMKLASSKGAKVLLDGQGADEILCGYRKARVYYIKRLFKSHKFLSAIWESLLYLPYARKKGSSLAADLSMLRQFFGGKADNNDIRREYLDSSFAKMHVKNSYKDNERYLVNDFEKISLPALLRYVDRNSMAFSIEERLPFLDFRLVEYCMKLPLGVKIERGFSKYIMRRALDMPEGIRTRRDKIGFYTPELDWIRKYSDEYRKVFENENFRASRYIDRDKILRDWDKLLEGKDSIGLFRYICLEKWMEIFNVGAAV